MKRLIFFICFAILFINVTAQRNKIDSLINILKKEKDSTAVLIRLTISELYRNISNDTSKVYARQALELATRNGYTYGEALAYNDLGFNDYVSAEYKESISDFEHYRELSQGMNDHQNAASAINNLGNVYIELGNYSKALGYYIEALGERKKTGNKAGIAQSYNNLGYLYKEIGDYDNAIENILIALKIFEDIKDENGISYCYTFLGIIYDLKRDFTISLKYHSIALGLERKINHKSEEAISLQSIATLYSEQSQFNQALSYYHQAEEIYKTIGDRRQIASITESIGTLYFKLSEYDRALLLFKEALNINRLFENKRGLSSNYTNIANCYLRSKNYSVSNSYLDSAFQYASQTGKREDLKNLYRSLSELGNETGDYKKAFINYKFYSAIKDSLFNIENSKSIAGMQTKYDTEKKELEIEEQKFKIVTRNYWIAGILVLSILGTLLAFSYYRRYQLKQEKRLQTAILKQQDLATKSIIEAEENERKRIAGDLHDGVGQLMSAAKMNLSSFESRSHFETENDRFEFEKIISLVDESCKEVRNVSHNMMPNALLKRGLSSAVKEFIDKIDHHVLKVNLYSEGLNERLDTNIETVLYRVIQECVNNVIKHSHANVLDISLIKDREGIDVTIEDNGNGFDTSEISQVEGIGLKNIRARIDYLKGSFDFDSAPGKGTMVAIHVPI